MSKHSGLGPCGGGNGGDRLMLHRVLRGAVRDARGPARARRGPRRWGRRCSGLSRHCPVRRSKLCLKMGEAIFGHAALVADDAAREHERLAERIEVVDGVDARRRRARCATCRAADQRADAGLGDDVVERADVHPVAQQLRARCATAAISRPPGRRRSSRLLVPGRPGRCCAALADEDDARVAASRVDEGPERAELRRDPRASPSTRSGRCRRRAAISASSSAQMPSESSMTTWRR